MSLIGWLASLAIGSLLFGIAVKLVEYLWEVVQHEKEASELWTGR